MKGQGQNMVRDSMRFPAPVRNEEKDKLYIRDRG